MEDSEAEKRRSQTLRKLLLIALVLAGLMPLVILLIYNVMIWAGMWDKWGPYRIFETY